MLRRIRPGYQLLDRRGLLVAGSGEVFDDQHAAALEHAAIDTISTAEPVAEPAAPAAPELLVAEPAVEAPRAETWRVGRGVRANPEAGTPS